MIKNDAKMMSKLMRYKLIEKWWKNDQNWRGKNRPKNGQKLICNGGVQKWSKSIKIDLGGPGGSIYKFFEILALFEKAPPFSTPKIDPHKWPYWKTHSPQIGCSFAPMGGSKMSLFGGSGGGPLGPKIVDTTI
jgi:hypothetical protein